MHVKLDALADQGGPGAPPNGRRPMICLCFKRFFLYLLSIILIEIGPKHAKIWLQWIPVYKVHAPPPRSNAGSATDLSNTILTLNYDLDNEPTLVKHTHCTPSHHTWHLCRVIWKSHQGFNRYRADRKAWRTDGRADRLTEIKQYVSPYHGGDIIYFH